MKKIIEVKFNDQGIIPAIAQDAKDGKVLMVAWMNEEALRLTVETGFVHYYSRSRNKLWKKGEESGHVQVVKQILTDCDRDVILVTIEQKGPGACHTGHRTCFYTDIEGNEIEKAVFDEKDVYKKK